MAIRVYNTLKKKKEDFEPLESGKVGMYVCGPTVYDSAHIGHARSVVVFDVIARYLRARGFQVTYVRNFTDVDDKIIARANEVGGDSAKIAKKYIAEFHGDMDALNVERPDFEPRVTENIGRIINFIKQLEGKGHAYAADGDVYYAVESFGPYGKLSGRKLEDMEAGARVEIDEKKNNPMDFALWKAAKPGEPAWNSPWGKGRPGWHIECSAMSYRYLGETFDIHGGGKDLIFPHHENEIAQSEGVFDKPFAKYWIHNGFVNIDQEKMSKSLGNFLMVKDVLKTYDPETVRMFLLSNHYRSPIDFTEKALQEADAGLERIYALLERLENAAGPSAEESETGDCWARFTEAMDDDFNTAKGIGILFEEIRGLNRIMDENRDNLPADKADTVRIVRSDILKIGGILGLLSISPADYFEKKRSAALGKSAIDPKIIDKMVHERSEARKNKDWATADRIRKELDEMNVVLEDRPDGTVWKIEN